ncbi:MAG: ABC transporter ATP-binding protein [Victivallaceae bacterium]|nr:ABC transporter ATP-binding protein [Victivallaceae bacterium]
MLKYLKNGLSRKLQDTSFSEGRGYGRLKDNLRYLFPSVKKNWRIGVAAGIFLAVSSVLSWPMPMIFRYLIDKVLLKKQLSLILPVTGIIVALSVTTFLTNLFQRFLSSKFTEETTLDLREKLLAKIFSLPKFFFDKNQSGYVMSRVSADLNGMKFFLSGTVTRLVMDSVRLIGGIIFLFYLEWRIALPVAATLPLAFVLTRFFARRNYVISHASSELGARLDASYMEMISNVQLIKSFAGEEKAVANIIVQAKNRIRLLYESITLNTLANGINKLLPSLAKLAVLITGSYWVISGHWEVGTLVAYLAYLSYVYNPVDQLSSGINQFQSARAMLDRIAAIFDMIPETNTATRRNVVKLAGKVAFEHVSFHYEKGVPVLNDVSFTANPGEVWTIAGKSGIGKTTLISLIMCFYRPQSGNICFDGNNVSELNVRSLRQRIGYVSQNIQLLSGSLLDNLKYGNPDAGMEEVVAACKAARIHDFIAGLPDRYDTVLAERGINFSEGQKQRIALARALIRDMDIIILDEPTSSLDSATENSVCAMLRQYFRGKTVFLIAHRAETVRIADKLILLREGESPRVGTMAEFINEPELANILE